MKWLLLAAILICLTYSFPIDNWEEDPEFKGNFCEGDMDLTEEEERELFAEAESRNAVMGKSRRWPNKTLRYRISRSIDKEHKDHIIYAMNVIQNVSCIKFERAKAGDDAYVHVTGNPTGCHSRVGYQHSVQQLNLEKFPINSGCYRTASIVHEFLHALGFLHQQSAPNRDKYVKIVPENIVVGLRHNFRKYSKSLVTDFGIEYDYGSVMHYGPYAFSRNGKKTIIRLDEEDDKVVMGQRMGLSMKDISS
uniref:Metalloendopeptidase n=1 Tax=Megaselia scalaris TaxID=36166 RepID=T1GHF5_MEGSC